VEVEAVGSAFSREHVAFLGGLLGAVAASQVSSGSPASFSASGGTSRNKGGSASHRIPGSSISASADSAAEAVAPLGIADRGSSGEGLARFPASSSTSGNKTVSAVRFSSLSTASLDRAVEAVAIFLGSNRCNDDGDYQKE